MLSTRFLKHSTPPKPDGTGMGLAICRSIVEVHGGKIIAHPGPSGGAVFELTIPCARGH
ncbi:ATP-binding protein [Pararhizobium sp. DWP3-4]|uniref:ATP-binding protein n=1 Tax=Pararhizobium sp. DWP3-4 TaxID=2804565 RepID=UPI003CEEB4CD